MSAGPGAGPGGDGGGVGAGEGEGQAPASPVDTGLTIDGIRSMSFSERQAYEADHPGEQTKAITAAMSGTTPAPSETSPAVSDSAPDDDGRAWLRELDAAVTPYLEEGAQEEYEAALGRAYAGDMRGLDEASATFFTQVSAAHKQFAAEHASAPDGRPYANPGELETGQVEGDAEVVLEYQGTLLGDDDVGRLLEHVSALSFQDRGLFEAEFPGLITELMVTQMRAPERARAIADHDANRQRDAEFEDWRSNLKTQKGLI